MPSPDRTPEPDDAHLADVVEAFLERHRTGQDVTIETWVAAHPECGSELADVLAVALEAEAAGDAATASSLRVPKRIGDVRIVGVLGRGGMGVVYDGRQDGLDRPVAVKVIASASINRHLRERFLREAKIAAQLEHPHIVAVHAIGTHDGAPYLVMARVQGTSLDARIGATDQQRPSAERQRDAVRWLLPALSAVEHAHRHGILHRDLKPGNLLLGDDGRVWVCDFGLAKAMDSVDATTTQGVPGTLRYLAPERFERPADARSDVYALGLTLLELASAKPVFPGLERSVLMRHIVLHGAPDPHQHDATLPPALVHIIRRATAHAPHARYADAAAFARDLEAWQAQRRPPGIAAPRWPWIIAGLVGAGCLVALTRWWHPSPPVRPSEASPAPLGRPQAHPPRPPPGAGPPDPHGPWVPGAPWPPPPGTRMPDDGPPPPRGQPPP